jgi:ribonucleoside-diphosphate reductase alpha chain
LNIQEEGKRGIQVMSGSERILWIGGDHWMHFQIYHPGLKNGWKLQKKQIFQKVRIGDAPLTKLKWTNRVKIQSSLQKHTDNAISSTINLPKDVTKEVVNEIYIEAWKSA